MLLMMADDRYQRLVWFVWFCFLLGGGGEVISQMTLEGQQKKCVSGGGVLGNA